MSNPEPTIRVNVDVTNPGQFFACCGLLELADRLWPGAEGWFSVLPGEFFIACDGTLDRLVDTFRQAEISSSLPEGGHERLGTLLSVAKTSLTAADVAEKQALQTAWRNERLRISSPFAIWLDWWRDDEGNRTELKTWAAKQMVSSMVRAMIRAIRDESANATQRSSVLFASVHDGSLPFNFDSNLCRSGNARDAGFSADTLNTTAEYRPLLELLAFIGLQRFRPQSAKGKGQFAYCVWHVPLPVSVAGAAATGNLHLTNSAVYRFELFHRTKYMKAFLPAQPQ